jgi:hypothetical protein
MDTPPVNRLLQLLRQKPPDTSSVPATSPHRRHTPKAGMTDDMQYVTSAEESDTLHAPFPEKSGIQSATFELKSNTPYATSDNAQYPKSDIQSATLVRESSPLHAPFPEKSDVQSATFELKSNTPYATKNLKSGTLSATKNDTASMPDGLSKGQRRVLALLAAKRDGNRSSQTIPIGYDAIARACFLSRSGLRKVLRELIKKRLIRRVETKRGEVQGSVYRLKSSILSATKSDTPYATSDSSCSSSEKEQLLQELVFDGVFQDLNPRSLLPYIERFRMTDELQNFLDIANACIAAAKDGHGKAIQNPHGFLIAQLRAGYINPPEGYKSRRVRAQELRNKQLEEELAELRRLKEREQELQFELFKARLSAEDLGRLEQEAHAQVKPHLGLSTERQLEVHKDTILRQWFAQRERVS